MASYVAGHPDNKVVGAIVLNFINVLETGREFRTQVFARHGIVDPKPDAWYPHQQMLSASKDMAENIGPKTLFAMGRNTIEKVTLPPLESLRDALLIIDAAYSMNVRGQNLGNYRLTAYDETARTATIVASTPSSDMFDHGLLTGVVRKFKPSDSLGERVWIDTEQPQRALGADTTTYQISW